MLHAALGSIELTNQQREMLRAAVNERGIATVAVETGTSIPAVSRAIAGLRQYNGTKLAFLRWCGAITMPQGVRA